MSHNVPRLCDVALRPTRPKGHVAEARGAAPRSPSRPAGAAMYIRAVIRSCVKRGVLWCSLSALQLSVTGNSYIRVSLWLLKKLSCTGRKKLPYGTKMICKVGNYSETTALRDELFRG
jgi:hypothetical protein